MSNPDPRAEMADVRSKRVDDESIELHYDILEKVYETALYNEAQISKQLVALKNATDTLRAEAKVLPAAVSTAVAAELEAGFDDVDSKLSAGVDKLLLRLRSEAEAAGSRIVERFETANAGAAKATAAYERAVRFSFWRVGGLAALGILCGVAAMVATAWFMMPDEKRLHAMRAEEARLESNIASLRQRGGDIEVSTCEARSGVRPCVRTDESDNSKFTDRQGETYRLIPRR